MTGVRTGIGYDSHRLVADRPLIIGGVEIEYDLGLDGHSDADVLTHAVIDALLGAAALGDIGAHFPDTDPTFAGADSLELLKAAVGKVIGAGFQIVNVDSTVVCERPKLGAYREAMCVALAGALDVPADRVNVKFTTGEGIGFVGRGEGVAAMAVVTLEVVR